MENEVTVLIQTSSDLEVNDDFIICLALTTTQKAMCSTQQKFLGVFIDIEERDATLHLSAY